VVFWIHILKRCDNTPATQSTIFLSVAASIVGNSDEELNQLVWPREHGHVVSSGDLLHLYAGALRNHVALELHWDAMVVLHHKNTRLTDPYRSSVSNLASLMSTSSGFPVVNALAGLISIRPRVKSYMQIKVVLRGKTTGKYSSNEIFSCFNISPLMGRF